MVRCTTTGLVYRALLPSLRQAIASTHASRLSRRHGQVSARSYLRHIFTVFYILEPSKISLRVALLLDKDLLFDVCRDSAQDRIENDMILTDLRYGTTCISRPLDLYLHPRT